MKKTPEQLADEIIKQMQDSGLTYDERLEVIKLVKEKLFLYETQKK